KLKEEFGKAMDYYLSLASNAQSKVFFGNYYKEAINLLANTSHFPLVRDLDTPIMDDPSKVGASLNNISEDMANSFFMQQLPADSPDNWGRLTNTVTALKRVTDALLDKDGFPRTCTISLASAPPGKDQWRTHWHVIKLDADTSCGDCNCVRSDQPHKLG